MRFYETTYEDYMRASRQYDLHPELVPWIQSLPSSIQQCPSLILYGPSGTGKYTQALRIIERFSPSQLKYMKYMTVQQKENTSSAAASTTGQSSSQNQSQGQGGQSQGQGQANGGGGGGADKEKNDEWIYRISDVHYEIDFALLGCESKKIWNECFFQIADIISMRPEKSGIILCRNFHTIHSELLNVFYSYMQHSSLLHIHIVFVLLTEHVSFIPSNIIQCCQCLPIHRPSHDMYQHLMDSHHLPNTPQANAHAQQSKCQSSNSLVSSSMVSSSMPSSFQGFYSYRHRLNFVPADKQTTTNIHLSSNKKSNGMDTNNKRKEDNDVGLGLNGNANVKDTRTTNQEQKKAKLIMNQLAPESILNLKELHYLGKVDQLHQLPTDLFNIVCDNIIQEMECMCQTMRTNQTTSSMSMSMSMSLDMDQKKLAMVKRYADFRDALYDILLYGIDITECLWYILNHYLVETTRLHVANLPVILDRIHVFLKYYNNNYRPIYHLESIFFFLIMQIHVYDKDHALSMTMTTTSKTI